MIDKATMSSACSTNDESVNKGLLAICQELSIEFEDLMYVSKQRAMRAILASRGQPMPSAGESFNMEASDVPLISLMTIVYMDAFITAVRCMRNTYQNGQRRINSPGKLS
jgi:hypothetical protein